MPLAEPLPFTEALDKLRQRIPTGRPWSSATWQAQQSDVRERAFFSAKVENALFLQRAKVFIDNFLSRNLDEQGMLKSGSMAQFVREMRRFAIREGMGKTGIPEDAVDEGDITDIRSEARLRLIFRTNTATSYGYGSWKQGTEPGVLEAFPAAKVVRNPGATVKRPRHVAEEGSIRLKTDYEFWSNWMNAPEIGGFQTPWPPYGFNSYIDQQDVSRQEAISLGLLRPSKPMKGGKKAKPGLNEKLKVSVAGLDPALREQLKAELEGIGVVSPTAARLKKTTERKPDASS